MIIPPVQDRLGAVTRLHSCCPRSPSSLSRSSFHWPPALLAEDSPPSRHLSMGFRLQSRMRLLLSYSLPAYHLEPGSSGLVWLGNGENFLALIPVAALLEVMSFLDRHRGRHSLVCACSAFQLPQPALHAARSMVSYASLQAPTEGPCVGLLGRWALCGGKHGCRDHSGGGGL